MINQEITRKIDVYEVIQRTVDGFFDGNTFIHSWNNVEGNSVKKMDDFLSNKSTKEFIGYIENENPSQSVVVHVKGEITSKGKIRDKVWMHPMLFIKFSMWLSPKLELKAIKLAFMKNEEISKQLIVI